MQYLKLGKQNSLFLTPFKAPATIGASKLASTPLKHFQTRSFFTPASYFSTKGFSTLNSNVKLEHVSEKAHEDLDGVYLVPHFRQGTDWVAGPNEADVRLPHPIWSAEELVNQVSPHQRPVGFVDRAAFVTVKILRSAFDLFTGYSLGWKDEKAYVRRVVVLETVAAVPGMVGGMIRHLTSLRSMKPDYGWIHTLLEEAENERMHLMIALALREPSLPTRIAVVGFQALVVVWYSLMYSLSPKYAHRFVGYLEEEAFKTYTALVGDIDAGKLPKFEALAPTAAQKYYKLGEAGTIRDMFLAMRADENHHREVNHTFANIKKNAPNPFLPGF